MGVDVAQLRYLQDTGEDAKNTMIAANMRLVAHVTKNYKGRGVAYSELVSTASVGLAKAVDKFDPEKGFRFSTYATWWIRQSVTRTLQDKSRMMRVPAHVHDLLMSLNKLSYRFRMTHDRNPTPEEVSLHLGIPMHKVEMLERHSRSLDSLDVAKFSDRTTKPGKEMHMSDAIHSSANGNPGDRTFEDLAIEEWQDRLTVLTPREAAVFEMRQGMGAKDGVPMTLDEVGAQFDLTRERIRQIEGRAAAKLTHCDGDWMRQQRQYLRAKSARLKNAKSAAMSTGAVRQG